MNLKHRVLCYFRSGAGGTPALLAELSVLFLIFLWSTLCFAQASYSGLTPGISTRADAERVLGNPVRAISETLIEYSGGGKILKSYVQYRPGSGTVERIEVLFSAVQTADQIFRELGLTAEPPANSKVNLKGKLEEYHSGALLVLTYKSTDRNSGVDRIGYYSKSLYETASRQPGKEPPTRNRQPNPPTIPVSLPPTVATYEQMTTDAWNSMLARDFPKALALLQQATRSDPEKGTAYSHLGIAYLYGFGDMLSAEKSMREALARNDRATFRVHHDHSGNFQTFCYGWLYIGKSEVQFQSDEGHGFRMNDGEIKEAKPNNLVGVAYFAFHIKTAGENYNLAPGSLKLQETNLILNLIQE